ncbi:MAG: PKD domain-containing protein [Candidatus Pacebacteria bacterium]|nr:PKD domain-containing protein [Candidatus Paceibacterota bacterium]MBP9818609.1 PKD domain-containing protein [Candidatus Paceibacterota bacterium]
MKKTHTFIKFMSLGVSLFILSAVFVPQTTLAFGDSDWSYGGWGASDDYTYDFTPNYYGSYANDDYTYDFTPNYYGSYANDDYTYDFTPNYYGSYAYDTPSYNNYVTPSYGGGYSTPSYGSGYASQPIYDYVYNTPSRAPSYGGGSSAPQSQYVYSSNENNNANANANDNTNTNTVTNTFNPTNINNNDARINLIVYGGGGSTTPAPTPALTGNCVISPTVGYINQDISFSASASGGNGSYSYSWTGDNGINSNAQNFTGRYSYSGYKTATVTIRSGSDSITRTCGVNIQDNYNPGTVGAYCVANPTNAGINQNVTWTAYANNTNGYYNNYSYSWTGSDNLYGNGQSISRSYNTPGYKTATVTMYGNGQSVTATCSTNINGVLTNQSNVTVIRDQNLGTPVSGVFLSQVPATGISFGLKMTLFSVGLVLWSLFAAYMISRKKNGAFAQKINAFKLANMQKKGIIG